jgi:hypothetical protein
MAHIVVSGDLMCTCSEADKCVLTNKIGSEIRCSEDELEQAGHKCIRAISQKPFKKLLVITATSIERIKGIFTIE